MGRSVSVKSLRSRVKDKQKFTCEVDEIENGFVISDYSGDKFKKFYARSFDEMLEILTALGHKR